MGKSGARRLVKVDKFSFVLAGIFVVLVGVVFSVGLGGEAAADYRPELDLDLGAGEHIVEFNESIFAEDLVLQNSEIESISYYDEFLGQTIGYVNVLGGVGDNFLIEPGREYEINIREVE